MHTSDVGVIGGGVMGLATARCVLDAGGSVTVYERGEPGNAQSGGVTRLFRHAHDDPRLVEMARISRAKWSAWQQRFGVELVSDDGAVAIGPVGRQRLPLMQDAGVPARVIDADELAERMPLLARYDGPALIDEAAGAIRIRTAVDVLADGLGESLVTDDVLSVRPTPAGTVEVRAGGVASEHGAVVVCAGVGTAPLARTLGVDIPVDQAAILRITFDVAGPAPARVAGLQDSSGAFGEPGSYGAPTPDRTQFAVGIRGRVASELDGTLVDVHDYANYEQRVSAYVAQALPGLDPTPAAYRHCWITELPWGHDGLGVWHTDGVTFLAGHNLFKFAPEIGERLATAALEQRPDASLSPDHRLGRAEAVVPGS